MSNSDHKKGDKKTFKKLVAQYQREGYPSKEAKKYASEEITRGAAEGNESAPCT